MEIDVKDISDSEILQKVKLACPDICKMKTDVAINHSGVRMICQDDLNVITIPNNVDYHDRNDGADYITVDGTGGDLEIEAGAGNDVIILAGNRGNYAYGNEGDDIIVASGPYSDWLYGN